MTPDRLDDLVADAIQRHNDPPAVPRERMWARIAARRRGARRRRFLWPPLVAAAALLLVFFLGREAGRREAVESPVPVQAAAHGADCIQDHVTLDLFARAEVLLTDFRTGRSTVAPDSLLRGWASGMLQEVRLFLDVPATQDPEVRELLVELEFVLTQIVQTAQNPADRAWILSGLEQRGTLEHLRLETQDGTRRACL